MSVGRLLQLLLPIQQVDNGTGFGCRQQWREQMGTVRKNRDIRVSPDGQPRLAVKYPPSLRVVAK